MPADPLVSVVVPTYNERDNVIKLVDSLSAVLEGIYDYEILVVDDSSPDMTWAAAARAGGRVRVLVRKRGPGGLGSGLASAIRAGILAARGELVVVMDADFQHPPEVVPLLVKVALDSGVDVVVASRYAAGGGVEGWSRLRLAMSKAATLAAWLLAPETRRTSDPMSGFFLVKKSRVVPLLRRLRPRGFKFLMELLVRAPHLAVAEVPYVFRRRAAGESKLGARAMADFVIHLLQVSRAARFAAVGLSGVAVNLGVMKAVLDATGNVDLASLAGIEASILSNFTLNDLWTFRGCLGGPLHRRLASYHVSVALGAVVTYATMKALNALAGVDPLLAQAAGIVAGFTANYLLSSTYVWGCWRGGQEGRGAR